MKLSIEQYNSLEKNEVQSLSNRFLQAFQPEVFSMVGFPTRIHHEREILRFIDSMHDGRLYYYCNELGFEPTEDEFELIKDLANRINKATLDRFGRGEVPKALLVISSHIERMLREIGIRNNHKPSIFEIGGGSGILGILLYEKGYRYISTDISQGFYLTQNFLFEELFPGSMYECVDDKSLYTSDLKDKDVIHIPYWMLWDV